MGNNLVFFPLEHTLARGGPASGVRRHRLTHRSTGAAACREAVSTDGLDSP